MSERNSTSIAGALQMDEVAGVAAARALELRDNNEKGSRARKKAALTDLLRTLAAIGVSKLRSAVPATERTVQAWFRQVRGHCHYSMPSSRHDVCTKH